MEEPDRPAFRCPARDLAGCKNTRGLRHFGKPQRGRAHGALRRPADAARVESLQLRTHREPEYFRAFGEEGSLLRKEGLEGSEVYYGGIGFDLAEVGVYGSSQREVRREPVLEIGAG